MPHQKKAAQKIKPLDRDEEKTIPLVDESPVSKSKATKPVVLMLPRAVKQAARECAKAQGQKLRAWITGLVQAQITQAAMGYAQAAAAKAGSAKTDAVPAKKKSNKARP